jgi:hypothetical protein
MTDPTPKVCKYSVCKIPVESSDDTRIVVEEFNGDRIVVKFPDTGSSVDVVYMYGNPLRIG